MAGFQKIDKKQLPQVIGLGVASAGLFGYFAFKMIAPTASAAPAGAATAPSTAATGTASGTPVAQTGATAQAGATATTAVADAPAPGPGMRSPFVPLVPPVQAPAVAAAPPPATAPGLRPVRVATTDTARSGVAVPAGFGPLPPVAPAPAAPFQAPAPGPVAPLPVAPPSAPAWTVTGVLQSGSENIAILRDGTTRAYVHPGDTVGDAYRVQDVTPQYVVLRHGGQRYTLPLGGPKTPPTAHATGTTAGGPASPVPTPDAGDQAVQGTIDQTTQESQQFQAVMQKLNALTAITPAPGTTPATASALGTAPDGTK